MAGRSGRKCAGVAAMVVALVGMALTRAQEPAAPKAQPGAAVKPAAKPKKGGLRVVGGVLPRGLEPRAVAADPLFRSLLKNQGGGPANNANGPALPPLLPDWPYHLKLRITGADGIPLAAIYYPSRARENAPVLVLVHATGTGHAAKDFEEPIEGLETPQGLAPLLQAADYAVLAIDLRGHGGSGLKQELTGQDWKALAGDLRTAYLFLVDRHNRQELNLAKLGLVALGDGGLLAAHWALSSNGPISGPGRLSDLGALAIVSPVAEAEGLRLSPAVNALAPRVPIMLVAGERDAETAKAAQKTVERNRLGRVALFETRLQGDVLVRLEPKVSEAIVKFLEEPVKFRPNASWQPRYLLSPIVISDVTAVDPKKPGQKPAAAKEPEKKAEAAKEPEKKAEAAKEPEKKAVP